MQQTRKMWMTGLTMTGLRCGPLRKKNCLSARLVPRHQDVPSVRKTRAGWNCRSEKTPRREGGDKVQAVSTQGSRQVAFPSAWNPRICSISRFRKTFFSNFPATFPEFSSGTPEQTSETATVLSFLVVFFDFLVFLSEEFPCFFECFPFFSKALGVR